MKVKMIEPVYFEGTDYRKDEEYQVPEETAKALGSSVIVLEESKKKIEKSPKDKMIKGESDSVKIK